MVGCIISFLYIKPQLKLKMTSNRMCCIISFLYIKPQLLLHMRCRCFSCIISFLYIKPQPPRVFVAAVVSCIISFLYIKPQHEAGEDDKALVVFFSFSTSNHNAVAVFEYSTRLYYIVSLHQTTTFELLCILLAGCIISFLYIKPQQPFSMAGKRLGCIISFLYIKPQP